MSYVQPAVQLRAGPRNVHRLCARLVVWRRGLHERRSTTNRCLALKPEFRMYREASHVAFFNRNPYEAHVRYRLPPAVAFVAALFGTGHSEDEVARAVSDTFDCSLVSAAEKVSDVVGLLRDSILVERRDVNDKWARFSAQKEQLVDLLYVPTDTETLRARISYNLAYVMTRRCVRNCLYCYADAGTRVPFEEDRMQRARVMDIISEAGRLGVSLISMSGGDPFVCPETKDYMLHALDNQIVPWVSTKALVNANTANELGRAGLPIIQVSIDSINPDIQDSLCGVEGSLQDLKQTITHFAMAGVDVYTNFVVTSANIAGIPSLVDWLLKNEVACCLLTPYTNSAGRHDDSLFPSAAEWSILRSWENDSDPVRVQLRFTKGVATGGDADSGETSSDADGTARSRCTAGREGFAFSWNGDVSPCERLVSSQIREAVVGTLAEQSIEDVWNSPKLKKLAMPSRGDCAGTACEECEEFEECLKMGGRCMIRSWLAYGVLLGPDPLCSHAPPSPVRIF